MKRKGNGPQVRGVIDQDPGEGKRCSLHPED